MQTCLCAGNWRMIGVCLHFNIGEASWARTSQCHAGQGSPDVKCGIRGYQTAESKQPIGEQGCVQCARDPQPKWCANMAKWPATEHSCPRTTLSTLRWVASSNVGDRLVRGSPRAKQRAPTNSTESAQRCALKRETRCGHGQREV